MCYRDRETRNKNTKLLLDEAEQLLDQITFSPASEGSDPLLKSVLPFTVSPLTVTMILCTEHNMTDMNYFNNFGILIRSFSKPNLVCAQHARVWSINLLKSCYEYEVTGPQSRAPQT